MDTDRNWLKSATGRNEMYRVSRKNYTAGFKQEAVLELIGDGKSPAQVARDLGIPEQRWTIGVRPTKPANW